MCLAALIGMAKQMPWADGMIAVLMPITCPRLSTSGPPLLPGFERGVGLNHVVDQVPGDAAQRAAQAH